MLLYIGVLFLHNRNVVLTNLYLSWVPRRYGKSDGSTVQWHMKQDMTEGSRGIKVTCIQPCGLVKSPWYERQTLFPCRNYCGLKCLANAHELVSRSKLNVGILNTQERERSNNHEILQKSQVGCISVQCCGKNSRVNPPISAWPMRTRRIVPRSQHSFFTPPHRGSRTLK